MNYKVLKSLIESLISHFQCPMCSERNIQENHVEIMGVAGNHVNLEIVCPKCGKHTIVKAEVGQLHIPRNIFMEDNVIYDLKRALEEIIQKRMGVGKQFPFSEKDIVDLRNKLIQNNIEVKDLFSDSENT